MRTASIGSVCASHFGHVLCHSSIIFCASFASCAGVIFLLLGLPIASEARSISGLCLLDAKANADLQRHAGWRPRRGPFLSQSLQNPFHCSRDPSPVPGDNQRKGPEQCQEVRGVPGFDLEACRPSSQRSPWLLRAVFVSLCEELGSETETGFIVRRTYIKFLKTKPVAVNASLVLAGATFDRAAGMVLRCRDVLLVMLRRFRCIFVVSQTRART